MSGLLFLTASDFSIVKTPKGDELHNKIKGFTFILFYSTACTYCKDFLPIFKSLPGSINGCQFGIVNVSMCKQMIIASQKTRTPIQYVPYIVLYTNGKPTLRYNGPNDIGSIQKFIVEAVNIIQTKVSFTSHKNITVHPNKHIPEYSLGVPCCGEDNVCYLNFGDAYQKK